MKITKLENPKTKHEARSIGLLMRIIRKINEIIDAVNGEKK